MKIGFKNLAIIFLSFTLVFLVAANSGNNNRFQITPSSQFPDIFVFDSLTQTLYRYTFIHRHGVLEREVIAIESFGPLTNPEYKQVGLVKGDEWTRGSDGNRRF